MKPGEASSSRNGSRQQPFARPRKVLAGDSSEHEEGNGVEYPSVRLNVIDFADSVEDAIARLDRGEYPLPKEPTRAVVPSPPRPFSPVTSNLPDSRRAREAFRALAERTWGQVRKGMPTGTATVAITSAEVGTGKSFVSINLGLSLSKALGARVLLIEGDLRRSRLHCYLNFDRQASTVRQFVEWNLDWPSLVISRVPGTTLDVLPAGSPQKEDLLVGDKLQSLLSQAKRAYDIVLVDCPPIPVASALRIATHCDYSIVVVRREFTRKNDLAATLTELGPDKVLGVVFGDDESPTSRIYDYY